MLKKATFSLLIFLLLTMAVIMPLLAWRPYLNRADLTAEDAGVFSLEPLHLVGLLLPAHEGNIETLTYLGFPVLVLAMIGGFSAPRQRAFWLILMLLATFYALGSNGFLWSLLVKILPILLWFRVPARAWFIVVLIAPLLAGYGLNTLMELTENRQKLLPQALKRRRLAAFSLLISMLMCGSFTLISLPLPSSVGISVIFTGGLVGGLLLAALNGWLEARYVAAAFILVTVVDLAWTDKRWAEWRGESDWLDPYRPLAERLAAENAARIYSPAYSLPQQVAAEYDLRLFGGVDPFQLTGIVNAIQQGSGIMSDDYSVIQPPLLDTDSEDFSQANREAMPDTQILAAWDVSHVIAAYPIEHDRLTLVDTIDAIYLYQNLDYVPLPEADASPNWAKNWVDLPDQATLDRLNQIAGLTALISGISFLLCLSLLFLWRRDAAV